MELHGFQTQFDSKNGMYNWAKKEICNRIVKKKNPEMRLMISLRVSTGLLQSFQTPKMCHLWLNSKCEKKCNKYQILTGIISTFSKKFIQFNQVWPQLQLQT